jgi:hypothetical protein
MAVHPYQVAAGTAEPSMSRPGASTLVLRAATDSRPSILPAGLMFPETTGLSGAASDERAVPLSNTNSLSMGPGGFGRIMTGKPSAAMNNWTDAGETAISYIRPHVNVEMMLAVEIPGHRPPSDFEGPGLSPHAYLDIDHRLRVDSQDIGSATAMFGGLQGSAPASEPQTAVAVGLDLGILPTFLSQMGLSLSVVASRGQQSGDTRVALVGNSELPVDWSPGERPVQHLANQAVQPLGANGGSTGYSGGGGGGGSSTVPPEGVGASPPLVPIVPVPEPATLVLLAVGAGAALARRRGRR